MDPRERADAALARARARGSFVITPESALSPMDATNTLQIPRSVVAAADDPEATLVVPQVKQDVPRPAIAQDAVTQAVAAPRRNQRQGDPVTTPLPTAHSRTQPLPSPHPRRQQPPPQPQPVQPAPEPEQLDGLVPTAKPTFRDRPTLTQRLDG